MAPRLIPPRDFTPVKYDSRLVSHISNRAAHIQIRPPVCTRTKFATTTTGASAYRLRAENIVTPAKHGADHSRSSAMHGTNPAARRHHNANQATQLFSQLRHMRHRSISRNESDAGTSGSHPHPHDRRAQAHLLTLGRNPQSTSRAHRRRVYLRTQTSTHAFIPVAVWFAVYIRVAFSSQL